MPRLRFSNNEDLPLELRDVLGHVPFDGTYSEEYGAWQFYDPTSGSGVEALAGPTAFAPWVASFPLRNFLHWGYLGIGWRLVHAATLGINGEGVIIIGAGGAGKSGTTLAGVRRGLQSVGDDYVALHIEQDEVIAHPVIKLMKQDAAGLTRLSLNPELFGTPNWQGKYEFDIVEQGLGKRPLSLRVRAILMPHIALSTTTTFVPVGQREAMLALAPSNLQQLPGDWRDGLRFIARVARSVPAYRVELSQHATEIAERISTFIQGGDA